MKMSETRYRTAAVLGMTAVMVLAGTTGAQALDKRYQIKSGKVTYTFTGDGLGSQKGREELKWIDFGRQEKRESEMEINVMGFNQSSRSVHVIDGEWAYTFDPAEKTATRIKYTDMLQEQSSNKVAKFQVMSDELLAQMGGVKTGTEKVLGRTCSNYHLESWETDVCVYKGVPLLTRMNLMGINTVIEAVAFEENAAVNPADVTLPEGLTIIDGTEMLTVAREAIDPQVMKETMGTLKQAGDAWQQSPEYQEYLEMKKAQALIPPSGDQPEEEAVTAGITQKAADAATQGVADGVTGSIKSETRRGVQKAIGGAFRSLF